MNERKFEYIDREKAIKELTDWKWGLDETCVMQAIGCVPAEDVAPVVRGKWILKETVHVGLKEFKCSECESDDYWKKCYCRGNERFCPNCGARMDGDSDA